MNNLIYLFNFLGLPRVASFILAVLLIENRELSLNDLVLKTGYAKSHLSTAVRTLMAYGLIEYRNHGRRKLYRVNKDGLINFLKNHIRSYKVLLENASQYMRDHDLRRIVDNLNSKLTQFLKETGG